jgi:hypothetical protein
MKKFILPALFMGAIAFGSTSCKKDYTCTCTYDDGNGSTATVTAEYTKVKKKDAEEACDSASSAGGADYKCELK